jgi:hypothetical protein
MSPPNLVLHSEVVILNEVKDLRLPALTQNWGAPSMTQPHRGMGGIPRHSSCLCSCFSFRPPTGQHAHHHPKKSCHSERAQRVEEPAVALVFHSVIPLGESAPVFLQEDSIHGPGTVRSFQRPFLDHKPITHPSLFRMAHIQNRTGRKLPHREHASIQGFTCSQTHHPPNQGH